MSIVERAAKQLNAETAKSVIERAAEQIGTEPGSPAETNPAALAGTSQARPAFEGDMALARPLNGEGRRETRRQIKLDADRLRAGGFALPQDQTPLAEEFRLVKRPLLEQALGPDSARRINRNMIMVTSANPHEGKSFVAINLAFSMASEHNLHVLLIDADVARPSVPRVLGFDAEMGLADILADTSLDMSEAMIRTDIDNLTIMPYGRSRPGSSEMLASSRMVRFVDEVSRRYADRIIIFDSPPVLARSEPLVLAKHVGQVVFVVEAERTSRGDIDEALGLIGQDRVGGIIFNKAPIMPVATGFGRHYGYYG